MENVIDAYRKLSVPEAARYLGVSKSKLDKLRFYGGGPDYLKLGSRVLYDRGDLEHWARRLRRARTSS